MTKTEAKRRFSKIPKAKEWFKLRTDRLNTFTHIKTATTKAEAWEKSITKWRLIMEGLFPDWAVNSCGLCDLYYDNHDLYSSCNGCPIKTATGYTECQRTPAANPADHLTTDEIELVYMFLLMLKENEK